jgi:dTDP-4-dehydrorhamnose reductase
VRLLVTGASGYLGAELMRREPAASGTYLTNPVPGSFRLDVREPGAVEQAVEGYDVVIHTAYVFDDAEVTGDGAIAVADACAKAGARLVHMSTDIVFGGTLGRPYTEDDEPDPAIDYGRAKLRAERAIRERVPGAAILRTSLICGDVDSPPGPQERLVKDPDITFFTDELRSPVIVTDLARAVLEIARSDFSGILHVAGADGVDRLTLAQLVTTSRGGDPRALKGAPLGERAATRPPDCRLDSTRCRELLGWAPRGVREALGGGGERGEGLEMAGV